MPINPDGSGELLDPYEQMEKNGYHLVSVNPRQKVASDDKVLRRMILDHLDALAYMDPDTHAELAQQYYNCLMRDEVMRKQATEQRHKLHGQRLGVVDIWEEIESDILLNLADALEAAAPEGYGFGPVPWTEDGAGFFPVEWYEDPEIGKQEYNARNQRA
jgi:hypothetical protein